ncbi:MAG: XdhC family protein [Clostridiales bacterium]|nr:XdhC family protein [Clostridiales bacterium]
MDALLIKHLHEMIEKREEVALVTVTNKAGSGPRGNGSMMLVDATGDLLYGTVGGGGIEERAKKDAVICLRENISKSFHYELTLEETESSLHMACGGVVDVFVKVFKNVDQLIIAGGGHIGLELSKFAKTLGYRVVVIDHREDFANDIRFSHVDSVLCGDMVEHLENTKIDHHTSVVIITHGHLFDLEALRAVVDSDARYIGMIGSKTKIKHCFDELEKEGVSKEMLSKVYAPIGIDIGGETPVEIALAILAEIQAVKYNKSGSFMKDL